MTSAETYEEIAGKADFQRSSAFRLASWACLFTSMSTTLAAITAVWIVREGNLGSFSPLQILQFIPVHLVLWRVGCLSASLATVSFVALVVAIQAALGRRLQLFLNFAVVLSAMAAANGLNAQFCTMVLLCDLALQLHGHAGLSVHADITHMAWVTINNSLTQTMLISNMLHTIVGFIISACILASRSLPKWLGWLAMPIWIVSANVSILTFIGALQWALVLSFAAIIAYIMWVTIMGLTLRVMARSPVEAVQPAEERQ